MSMLIGRDIPPRPRADASPLVRLLLALGIPADEVDRWADKVRDAVRAEETT